MATATTKTAPSGIFSNIDLEDLDLNNLAKFLAKVGRRVPLLSNLVTTQMGDGTLDNYTPEELASMIMKSNIPDVVSGEDLSSDPVEVARKKAERQAALDEARRNRTSATVADKVRDAAEAGEYGLNPFIDIDPNINQPKIEIFPELTEAEKLPATTAGGVININDLINEPLIMAQDPDAGKSTTLSTPPLNSEDQLPTIYTMAKMGPAPKNLKPAADKWLQDNPGEPNATAMDVFLNEPDKYLKTGIVNIGNIKDRRIALGISTPEGKNINKLSAKRKENTFTDFKSNLENIDMNNSQAVLDAFRNSYKKGYSETEAAKQYEETGSLAKSESANSQINKLIDQFENTEGGFKILKQKEINKLNPKKKRDVDTFAEYYRSEFNPDKSIKDVKTNSEFRFFNSIRRTEPNLEKNPEAFFGQYKKESIQPGGDLHEKYLQFEKIDQIRKTNVDELKPILVKVLSELTNKDAKADFQIAHKYMTSGIKEGFVSESKTGTGADIAELYIDISDYNSSIQNVLEGTARKIIKQGLEDGKSLDEIKNMRDFKLVNLDMENLGVQGEAYGLTIGKAKAIEDKIGDLIIRGLNRGTISDAESDIAEKAVDEILKSKQEFEIIFQQPAPLAKGGLVGISHLTRPL
jgi:hypothetical protein